MERIQKSIQALYPSTKFLVVLFVFVTVFIVPGYIYPYLMLPICILIAFLGGVLKDFLNLVMKSLFIIALFIFILQSLFYPGDTIVWQWGIISIVQEGIDYSLILTSRILAIGSSFILFFRLTSIKDIVYALEKAGSPRKLVFVILSTFKMIPEMKKLSIDIMDAQRSRGVETEGNVFVRALAFIPMLSPLVLSSISNTEERVLTLESRAFSSKVKKTSLYHLEKTKNDKVIILLLLLLFITLVIGRIVL